MVFTSWPIIIFAVFDWEYTKEFYMRKTEAFHYKLGLKNYLFNSRYFWRWFGYALIQAALLLVLTFITLDDAIDWNGRLGSLEGDGQFLFGAVVIIVNVRILSALN